MSNSFANALPTAAGTLLLLLIPGTTFAQDIYGAADISLGYSDVTDDGSPEGHSYSAETAGYVGMALQNDFFLEGDLRLKMADTQPADNSSLDDGQLIAVRFGRDWGAYTGEAILGYANAHTTEGTTGRGFAALAGSYRVSDRFTATGLVGYLDGTDGTDDDGEDGIRELWHVSFGGAYQINDRFGVWGNATYGEGGLDNDADGPDYGDVAEISLGLDYQFANPALRGYMGVTYADYFQGDENDDAQEARVNLGVVWTFGGNAQRDVRTRPALPAYENWLATTASVLE